VLAIELSFLLFQWTIIVKTCDLIGQYCHC